MALQLPGYSLGGLGGASPPHPFTNYDNTGYYKMADAIAGAGKSLGDVIGSQRANAGLAEMAAALNKGDYAGASQAAAAAGDKEMAMKLALAGISDREQKGAISQLGAMLGGDTGGPAPATGISQATGAANTRPVPEVITSTAQKYGIDPNDFARMAWIESKFNPQAQANGSSAGGLFQFIDSTAKQYGLANKFDAGANADAAARLWNDNKAKMTSALGREPTGGELYLAHQQGIGGALRLLKSGDTPAANVVGSDAVRLNGGDAGMSSRDFANLWISKFNRVNPGVGAEQGPMPQQDMVSALSNMKGAGQAQGSANGSAAPNPDQTASLMAKWENLNKAMMSPAFARIPEATQAGIKAQADMIKYQLNQANEAKRWTVEHDPAAKIKAEIAARSEMLQSQGLDPKDPKNQQFLMSGKWPREDQAALTATDKKAILDADQMVTDNKAAIDALTYAKGLSKKAMGFPGAGVVAKAGSLIGNDAALATQELDNTVTSNALAQLKSTFGGNPTEGERAILLQIQGASSQPDAVRQKIYDRAIDMANRRLEFNQQRANELRGGDYYKTGGGVSNNAPKSEGAQAPTAMEGRTATNPQTGQRIILRNGRWEPL